MEQVNGPAPKLTSIFKEARLAADHCKDAKRRDHLRATIDTCREDYDLLVACPARERMVALIASWTHMLLALDALDPLGGDPENAGRVHAPAETPSVDLKKRA